MRLVPTAFLAAIVACIGAVLPAQANDWPSKPIKLVVPFTPGGGTDIIARVLGNHLTGTLKQSVIIENRPGAGGNIGIELTAKAPPDGYTIVLGQTSNLAINPTLYPKLPYDPLINLAPVALVADAPLVLVVGAESNIRTLAELVATAKAKPEVLTIGSPGNGTVAHLAGTMLQKAAGISLTHIPYKGSAQALTDLMAGRLDTFMSSVPTALGQIESGKLRAIAVTSAKRSPRLPAVPTLTEAGLSGFDLTTWFGIVAPAETPRAIIEKLNGAINAALTSPEVADKIATEGGAALGGTPEQFAAYLKSQIAAWAVAVRDSGAKVD